MGKRAVMAAAFACVLLAAPAQADEGMAEAGLGAGSAFATLLYGPAKVVYSALGLVFGGIAWGLSGGDNDVARAVITPAVRGDYVVTPSHLRGQKSLEFIGRDPAYRPPAAEIAAPPPSADPYASEDPYASAW